MTLYYNPEIIENAVLAFSDKIDTPKEKSWALLSEYDMWHELVSCILGSRVSHEISQATLANLNRKSLLVVKKNKRFFDNYENELYDELIKPVEVDLRGKKCLRKYPFAKQKANHIARTACNIYSFSNLKSILYSSKCIKDARNNIIFPSVGIGPKQASLFLRNVGYFDDFAIMDKHVLDYMYNIGLLSKPIKSIPNLKKYEILEVAFNEYAVSKKISVARLDIAIWIIMRVYKREFVK